MFTTLGRIAAILILLFSTLRIAMALWIITFDDPETKVQAAKYFLDSSTGHAIDQALYAILVAIALGVLTDISRRLENSTND